MIKIQHSGQRIETIATLFLIILTAYSVVVRIQLYGLGVTLWYDEGLLVTNIISQDFFGVVTTPLNTGWGAQSAPLFFIAVVKLFTMAFGINETSVRLYSFIVCIGMLVCLYFLVRKALKQSVLFTWLTVCLTATLPLYVRYANEMKPYMGDVFFALLLLLAYYLLRSGRLNLVFFTLICVVAIFFSTPSVFFVAAVFIVEGLRNLKNREYRATVFVIIAGLIAAAAFGVHYLYWLQSTANDPFMSGFWEDYRFRFPFSVEAVRKDIALSGEYFLPLGRLKYMFLAFGAAGYFISLVKRNLYSLIVGFAFVLLLVASSVGMYPIISRLWLFFFVFCIIYTVYFIAHLRIKLENQRAEKVVSILIATGLSLVFLAGNVEFASYAKAGHTDSIYPGMNVNPLIDYVEENIRDGETLYSFETATPNLWFRNGYDNARIGNVTKDNIIFGTMALEDDVRQIVNASDVYVLYNRGYIPYSYDTRLYTFTDSLAKSGYMDRALNINYTPLYWFTTDITHLKTSAEIELTEKTEQGYLTVRITNTGKTILESRASAAELGMTGPVKLVARLYDQNTLIGEQDLAELSAPLLPGEQVEIALNTGVGYSVDHVVIDLVSEGRYDFSAIGMQPIEINP